MVPDLPWNASYTVLKNSLVPKKWPVLEKENIPVEIVEYFLLNNSISTKQLLSFLLYII